MMVLDPTLIKNWVYINIVNFDSHIEYKSQC